MEIVWVKFFEMFTLIENEYHKMGKEIIHDR